jgi:transcriptional regulator with XRE-family HTH domain
MSSVEKTDALVNVLGNLVQQQRKKLGLSQDDLAVRAGLHRTYISEIERRSRNLSVKILVQIAVALDVEPSVMLRKAEDLTLANQDGQQDVCPNPKD